ASLMVVARAEAPGDQVLRAHVAGAPDDSDPTNNDVEDHTPIAIPTADLGVSIASTRAVRAGQDLTYTLMVTNFGPERATEVTVPDTLPLGVDFVSAAASQGAAPGQSGDLVAAFLGSLAAGASATVTIVVRPRDAGPHFDSAVVRGDGTDPDLANN